MFHVEHLPNTEPAAIWASGVMAHSDRPDRRRDDLFGGK
jgi:hypothetical protein